MSDRLLVLTAIGGHSMMVTSFMGPSKEIGLCLQFNVGRDLSQLSAREALRLRDALTDWLETEFLNVDGGAAGCPCVECHPGGRSR